MSDKDSCVWRETRMEGEYIYYKASCGHSEWTCEPEPWLFCCPKCGRPIAEPTAKEEA